MMTIKCATVKTLVCPNALVLFASPNIVSMGWQNDFSFFSVFLSDLVFGTVNQVVRATLMETNVRAAQNVPNLAFA